MQKEVRKCSVEGCDRMDDSLGYCTMHYLRHHKGISDMRPGKLNSWTTGKRDLDRNSSKHCSVLGCKNKFYSKGFCKNHYTLHRRNGFPGYKPKPEPKKCLIAGCLNLNIGSLGLCRFHYDRKKMGVNLERKKGIKDELNPRWNGGISQYKNHYQLKKIRLKVLEEARYKCFHCGNPCNQTHHKDNKKSNHNSENLVAVCSKCHRGIYHSKPHQRRPKFVRNFYANLNMLG